jgi:replicative DNA helicase
MDKLTKTSFEKLPPYNIEAEQAVLGAILLDNAAIFSALEIFNADDFYRAGHQKIFQAMLALSERGDAIDLLTLRDELEGRKELDEIGGPAYLATLIDLIPTAANIEFHAKLVHEKSIARRLLNASIEIATRCYDEAEDVDDVLGDAEQKIFAISEGNIKRGFTPISAILKESYAKIEELAQRQTAITGIPTGFIELDHLLSGLQPSDLLIIAARPAMGKTSFCLNIAQHIGARAQVPLAIFNLEMSKEQLGMRLLCAEARLNSQNVRVGQLQDEDWERLAHASEVLSKAPIYIDDTPAITTTEIRAKVKRLKMEKGLGVVMIDYLQLMQAKQRYENRQQEISALSRSLKMLAKELNVPVICLSQLSRAVEQRTDKRPQLSDLRESGSIEQDADIVMFIYRPEVYFDDAPEGIAEIIIGKHRNGPVGTLQLAFIKDYTRFENLESHHDLGNLQLPGNPPVPPGDENPF